MPNWCMNSLSLYGPKDVLEEIAETKLSLQELFPCPEELKNTQAPAEFNDKEKYKSNVKKYGFGDWYSWQVSNWGTKWDIGPLDIDVENDGGKDYYISVDFDSAWSPPVSAIQSLYNKYKSRGLTLYMEYFEPGCAFVGTCQVINGEFRDECFNYSNSTELKEAIDDLGGHTLGEGEIDYLIEREREEAEEQSNKQVEENNSKTTKKVNKKTKKPVKTTKKSVKKPVKKSKKVTKPVKKSTKKSVKKPIKKAAQKK